MFKKVPFFLGVIMLSLAAVTFSCNKHDDDDDDWGGGNGGGINIVDNTIIGTWGVERIENIIISNNGETIQSASTNYNPNYYQWVFRENKTGELREDGSSSYSFTYSYESSDRIIYINGDDDDNTFTLDIIDLNWNSLIFEIVSSPPNEWSQTVKVVYYLKRLSNIPK